MYSDTVHGPETLCRGAFASSDINHPWPFEAIESAGELEAKLLLIPALCRRHRRYWRRVWSRCQRRCQRPPTTTCAPPMATHVHPRPPTPTHDHPRPPTLHPISIRG